MIRILNTPKENHCIAFEQIEINVEKWKLNK